MYEPVAHCGTIVVHDADLLVGLEREDGRLIRTVCVGARHLLLGRLLFRLGLLVGGFI